MSSNRVTVGSALPTGTNSIGQVTANAGTNLNTSALALDATLAALNVLEGAVTETAPATDTASSGLNGRLQRIAQRLTSLIALLPTALGAGGGLKVDGSGTALPVSGTVTATGPLTDTQLRATAVPVSGTVAISTALALDATVGTTNTEVGGLTEAAPATDTASSGLNGRLQRIAQRLTSVIALLPTALGAGGGLKVDGSGTALPVSLASVPSHAVTNAGTFAVQNVEQSPPTTANNQVNVTNSAATLVAQRLTRKQLTIVNRQVSPIFVGIATVSTANGFQVDPGASLTLYTTALIQAITAAASGATEKTHYVETY